VNFRNFFFLKCALNVFSSKAGHRGLVIRQPGTTEADLGVTRVTSHLPLTRQPISCYYYACDLSYFDVVLCHSSSRIHFPVSPDPFNARLLCSLGFPSKNSRSANGLADCSHKLCAFSAVLRGFVNRPSVVNFRSDVAVACI